MKQSLRSFSVFLLLLGFVVAPNTSVLILNDQLQNKFSLSDGESWLDGWNYRMKYNITGASGAGTNYQVFLNISYLDLMQTDFDDLRFTDNDGITLLDAWLEDKIDSSYASIWFEVKDSLETDSSIYIYFGNSTVSNYWNGPATFLLFDDFDDASYNTTLWDTIQGTEYEGGGELVFLGSTITICSDEYFSSGVAMAGEVVYWDIRAFGFGQWDPFTKECYVDTFNTPARLYCRTGSSTTVDEYTRNDAWQILSVYWYNGSYASVYEDYEKVAELSHANVPDDDMPLLLYVYDPDNEYMSIKWVFVRNLADSVEPSLALDGDWTEVGSSSLLLSVEDPIIVWAIDLGLIILGLVLIPSSTMFLAYGGKKKLSSDKLFFALIALFFGIALVVGGVMP